MIENNENKMRISSFISQKHIKMRDAGTLLGEHKNKSEFIEKAIEYYTAYLLSQESPDFFAKEISKTVEGVIGISEKRLARLLFKVAVELAKLQQLLVGLSDMDEETMRILHLECINEVKKINGIIGMEDAFKVQRDKE